MHASTRGTMIYCVQWQGAPQHGTCGNEGLVTHAAGKEHSDTAHVGVRTLQGEGILYPLLATHCHCCHYQ